jgi:acetyl esterase/lipase
MTRCLAILSACILVVVGCASAVGPSASAPEVTSRPSPAPSPAPTAPVTASASIDLWTAMSPSPSASRVIDLASPDTVSKAGGCDESGNCRLMEVGLWHAVPFTPFIRCGLSSETCQLHFEIYAPTSGGPWPLFVLEPGGDIAPGEPGDYLDQMATALAGRGAVVMVGQWRQSSYWAGRSPDSFADVACAIGVARRIGPAFGADPDRVVLAGHSMSTRPVAVVGLTAAAFTPASGSCDTTAGSLRPDAWADLAGPRDDIATAASDDFELVAFFGGTRASASAAWAAGDPFALAAHRAVAATDLSIVLLHGGLDDGVADARAFQAVLAAGRHHSRLIEIPSADHFGTTVAKESIEAVFALATAK